VIDAVIGVESYLRTPDGEFVPVSEATAPPPNDLHIEGAIHLSVNGVDVLDTSLWDDVDQLWAYIATMLDDLAKTDRVSTYFPDQPIEFAIERMPGRNVRVSTVIGDEKRRTVVAEESLVSALREAGLAFFDAMSRLVPANAATYRYSVQKLSPTLG
jgi:hypothetical protein